MLINNPCMVGPSFFTSSAASRAQPSTPAKWCGAAPGSSRQQQQPAPVVAADVHYFYT